MEFALVVPLLLGVVLAVLQIGGWFLHVSAATADAHEAARAAARARVGPHRLDELLPADSGARVSTERVAGDVAVRVEIPVPLRIWAWEMRRSAVAVIPLEPR